MYLKKRSLRFITDILTAAMLGIRTAVLLKLQTADQNVWPET